MLILNCCCKLEGQRRPRNKSFFSMLVLLRRTFFLGHHLSPVFQLLQLQLQISLRPLKVAMYCLPVFMTSEYFRVSVSCSELNLILDLSDILSKLSILKSCFSVVTLHGWCGTSDLTPCERVAAAFICRIFQFGPYASWQSHGF